MFARQKSMCHCVAYQLRQIRTKKKYKKKLPGNPKKKLGTELALEHFDTYYKPVYGDKWPSIRLALLCQQKYGALVNNYALNATDTTNNLLGEGAQDMIQLAVDVEIPSFTRERHKKLLQNLNEGDNKRLNKESSRQFDEEQGVPDSESLANVLQGNVNPSLYDFMPTERVLSAREKLEEEVMRQSTFRDAGLPVTINAHEDVPIAQLCQMFTFEKGDVRLFDPPSKGPGNKFDYYVMDAASVLPVMALNLEPGCTVLDLCAAPGGKALAMLQTLLPKEVLCMDISYPRLQRLKTVMRSYLPKSSFDEGHYKTKVGDAIKLCEALPSDVYFDKVLVDVPCNTDRHSLQEDENNKFSPKNVYERLRLTSLQTNLLCAGIKKCRPGGTIVYSTCTLSPSQNDGVIQAALEKIWKTSKIDLVVHDLSLMAYKFKDTFFFHNQCRYGQLVLPNVTANFGPMYICKLYRVN